MSYQPAIYKATICGQKLGESSQKKTPHLRITFQPMVKKFAGQLTPVPDGSPQRFFDLWLTDDNIDRVVDDLTAMGWTGNSLTALDEGHPNCYSMFGWEIEVEMKTELYDGKPQERWSYVNPNRQFFTPLSDDTQRNLDQMFGDKLRRRGGQAVAVVNGHDDSPINPDDIPF